MAVVLQSSPTRASLPAAPASSAPMDWASLDLHTGDLVFRAGLDMAARIILMQGSDTVFSHVGIVVEMDGFPVVVHAVPEEPDHAGGVVLETLEQFSAPDKASLVGAYRLLDADDTKRAAIRTYAMAQIGKPFDDAFSMASDDGLYCTELALKSLRAVGLDVDALIESVSIPTLPERVFTPDGLTQSTAFQRINPMRRQVVESQQSDHNS